MWKIPENPLVLIYELVAVEFIAVGCAAIRRFNILRRVLNTISKRRTRRLKHSPYHSDRTNRVISYDAIGTKTLRAAFLYFSGQRGQ